MLNPEDRRAIEGLFARLADVERKNPERDPEAQELIDQEIVRQPGAPYYMAQTIVVQQNALEVAERRIQELEREAEERGRGGVFGGLFDGARGRQSRPEDRQPVQRNRGPWGGQDDPTPAGYQRGQGGGFLAGAAQTAVGVAGGVLLGSAIASLLGAGGAQASEAPANDQSNEAANEQDQGHDQASDQPVDNDAGGDGGFGDSGGDGGGFDMGGDF